MKILISLAAVLALTMALPAYSGKHADLNGDGQVSLEEKVASRQQLFIKLDVDKSGALSTEELIKEKNEPNKVQDKMAKWDANHDGQISSVEFSAKANARLARHKAR